MQTEPAESELSAGDTSFRQNHPPHTTVLVHYAITQGLQRKAQLKPIQKQPIVVLALD